MNSYVKKFPKTPDFECNNFFKGYYLSDGKLGIEVDYFITTIFVHDGFENEIKDRPRTDQEPTKLNEQEIKILEFCKEPHSKKEIMEYMEYKHARNFTMLYLKPLLEKELLQMTIPEKPNHKNQKYVSI